MYADDNFLIKCPSAISVSQWCLNPPSNGTCCGICPNSGISGIEEHISLAFSSLASIAAIALSPESAPSTLFVTLLQCNAYAISLLIYLMTGTSTTSRLDFFHAGYALMLALSCLIPLTAIAASPPWAVTGQENPAVRSRREAGEVATVMKRLEQGADSDSDSDDGKRKRDREVRKRFLRAVRRNPRILEGKSDKFKVCGVSLSHLVLYVGFSISVLLWALCFYLGLWGVNTDGTGTYVTLSQPNCTEELGGTAQFLLYCNLALLLLAVVVFIATIINPLVTDVADALNRESLISCTSNQQIVFGAAFAVWILWMIMSFYVYISAADTILLAGSEFSWSFGSTFSALMVLVPISNVIQAMWANR